MKSVTIAAEEAVAKISGRRMAEKFMVKVSLAVGTRQLVANVSIGFCEPIASGN